MVRLAGVGQKSLQQKRAAPLGCPTAGIGQGLLLGRMGGIALLYWGGGKKRVVVGGNIWFSWQTSGPDWCLNQNC